MLIETDDVQVHHSGYPDSLMLVLVTWVTRRETETSETTVGCEPSSTKLFFFLLPDRLWNTERTTTVPTKLLCKCCLGNNTLSWCSPRPCVLLVHFPSSFASSLSTGGCGWRLTHFESATKCLTWKELTGMTLEQMKMNQKLHESHAMTGLIKPRQI